MASFNEIRKGCGSRKRYADGGSVSSERKGSKTVVNIITQPPAAVPAMPPAAPMGNSPSPAGPPVPPGAAAMALGQMQGKPGAPGAFKHGGTVRGKQLTNASGGAAGGKGRLRKVKIEKR